MKRFGLMLTIVAATVFGLGAPATADPTLSVSVTGASLTPGGLQVVLTGRYTCGPFAAGADGVVDLTARQGSTTGYGYLYPTACDGSPQPWSAPVDSVGGQFVRGRAQVSGSGYVCEPGGQCAFGSFGPTTVRVR
jgi:hypothetical protein